MPRRILALLALLLTLCVAVRAPAADPAPLSLIQEIKDGTDGVVIKNHVGPIRAVGDYVYAGVIYEGLINCFKRQADGQLKYQSACDVGKATSFGCLVMANGHMYGNGGSGHWSGDAASRGLHWFDIDQASGKLTEKGTLEIPISAGLVAAPDGKAIYLLLQNGTVVQYTLAPDGTPAKAHDLATKTVPAEHLLIAPDGKSLYFESFDGGKRQFSMIHVRIEADGTMKLADPCSLQKLIDDSTFPAGKWGFGWGHEPNMSPDGRQLYVDFYNYGDKAGLLAILSRDPQSGELTWQQRVDTVPEMVKMICAFEPDGTIGYFGSGGESSGNCVGAFSRDPKTGTLTFTATENAARHRGPCSIELDAKNGYLYIGGWASKTLLVLKTHPPEK